MIRAACLNLRTLTHLHSRRQNRLASVPSVYLQHSAKSMVGTLTGCPSARLRVSDPTVGFAKGSETMDDTILARFMAKFTVNAETGCWEWVTPNGHGYGSLARRINKRCMRFAAHRLSYEHFVGPIPDGLDIDHLCRVRHCVNPAHMEPVTRRENTMRGNSPCIVTHRTGICGRGHEISGENVRMQGKSRVCKTCAYAATNACKRRIRRMAREAAANQ